MGKLDDIVRILERELELKESEFVARHIFKRTRDPFRVLVATIISQNTTDVNTSRALRRLSKICNITPESIASTSLEKIREAIRPAGLQDAKAKAIKDVALMIVNEYNGDILRALSGELDEVRMRFSRIKGIGYKTIDVVLMNLGYPVIAIDTHIKRIAKRLGLAPDTDSYLAIQRLLQKELEHENPLKTHLLLIKFGRTICRARRPRCSSCPLRNSCQYYSSTHRDSELSQNEPS
mgnify:CR=1 FL=1